MHNINHIYTFQCNILHYIEMCKYDAMLPIHWCPADNKSIRRSLSLNYSGSTYSAIQGFLDSFGVASVSSETFYRFQAQYMVPTVDRMYSEQEKEILKNMKERSKAFTSNKINYCLKYKSPLDVFAVYIYIYCNKVRKRFVDNALCYFLVNKTSSQTPW